MRPRLHIHGKHVYTFHPYKSVWYLSHAEHFISNKSRCGCMKKTRMPPAQTANLVANSGNTIYGVSVILTWVCWISVDASPVRLSGDNFRIPCNKENKRGSSYSNMIQTFLHVMYRVAIFFIIMMHTCQTNKHGIPKRIFIVEQILLH